MHIRLVCSKGDLPWVELICILLEKNIGPPTKAMHHGGSFSLDLNPQSLMRICLCIKEESIIYFLCCPGMDVLKLRSIKRNQMRSISLDRCTGGIEVPLCDTWLKHMQCNDNPWGSELIRTRSEHY